MYDDWPEVCVVSHVCFMQRLQSVLIQIIQGVLIRLYRTFFSDYIGRVYSSVTGCSLLKYRVFLFSCCRAFLFSWYRVFLFSCYRVFFIEIIQDVLIQLLQGVLYSYYTYYFILYFIHIILSQLLQVFFIQIKQGVLIQLLQGVLN